MDDVLENLSVSWIRYLNEKYGLSVDPEEVTDWDIASFFPSLTREQVFSALRDGKLWDAVEPTEDAPEAMQRLLADGHTIYIVTATHYDTAGVKFPKALFRWYPFLDWQHVIVTYNKQMIRGDVLIDDGFHNLVGGTWHKILMDRPYNRKYSAADYGIWRVKTWNEIEAIIKGLSAWESRNDKRSDEQFG